MWNSRLRSKNLTLYKKRLSKDVTLKSNRSQTFPKFLESGFKNFADFTKNHQHWSLFVIKWQSPCLNLYLKKDPGTDDFLWFLQNF